MSDRETDMQNRWNILRELSRDKNSKVTYSKDDNFGIEIIHCDQKTLIKYPDGRIVSRREPLMGKRVKPNK